MPLQLWDIYDASDEELVHELASVQRLARADPAAAKVQRLIEQVCGCGVGVCVARRMDGAGKRPEGQSATSHAVLFVAFLSGSRRVRLVDAPVCRCDRGEARTDAATATHG